MKTRKLILIVADLLLLLVCICQLAFGKKDNVRNFDLSGKSDIDRITLTLPSEKVDLVKEGENWFATDKKFPVTKSFADNFVEALKSVRAIDKVATSGNDAVLERYELNEGKKITVTAYAGEKVLRTLEIGKNATASSQSYITVDGGKDIYLAAGGLRGTFDITLNQIRSKTVWQFEKEEISGATINLLAADGQNESSYTITKMGSGEDVKWNIQGAELEIDPAKAQNWFNSLANLSTPQWRDEGEDLGGQKIASAKVTHGLKTASIDLWKIETTEPGGEDQEDKTTTTYWAKSSESPYTFELAAYSAEKFTKTPSDFAK